MIKSKKILSGYSSHFDVEKAMNVYLWLAMVNSNTWFIKQIIRAMLKCLFLAPKVSLQQNVNFITSSIRSDLCKEYDELVKFVGTDWIKVSYSEFSIINVLSIPLYIRMIQKYDHVQAAKYNHENICTLGRLYLKLKVIEQVKAYLYFLEELASKRNISLVFLQEMSPLENVMCQAANHSLIKTLALQHGIYSDDGAMVQKTNINSCNYLSTVAKTVFVWGEQSKEIYNRYTLARCVVVGRCKHYSSSSVFDQDGSNYDFVLIYDSVQKTSNNKELDNIYVQLSSSGLVGGKIYHPDAAVKSELKHFQFSKDKVIIVGCDSTILLDYYYRGYRVLTTVSSRYKVNIRYNEERYEEALSELDQSAVRYFVRYVDDNSMVRYIKLIDQAPV